MAYSSGGLIEASDINGFLSNNTDYLNRVWSTGSGDYGYGQSAVTTVSVGDIVVASPWTSLVNNITKAASHQGSSITSRTAPATGDLISILSDVSTDITTITSNRRNAASQGGTSSTTATTGASWSNFIQFTMWAQFGSDAQARWFFNSGGQLGISMSHSSSTNINALIQRLCSDVGTVWLSSGSCTLAGTNYTGTTRIGGGGSATITTGTSAYNSGTMAVVYDTTAYNGGGWPTPTVNYTTDSYVDISVWNNGAGLFTFTVILDEVPNGATVADGTSCTITARQPETTYLSDSWGGPSLSGNAATS
jgi:hypothetical protein